MSDEETGFAGGSGGAGLGGGSGAPDEEATLPRATVQKLIQEMLPSDISCARDTRDLLIECCVGQLHARLYGPPACHVPSLTFDQSKEFIHLVSSEANDVCEKGSKKTIAPEHVVAALKDLGFEKYTTEVEEVLKEHKTQQKDREKKTSRMQDSGLSAEELQRQQEMLFAASRARFEASN